MINYLEVTKKLCHPPSDGGKPKGARMELNLSQEHEELLRRISAEDEIAPEEYIVQHLKMDDWVRHGQVPFEPKKRVRCPRAKCWESCALPKVTEMEQI